MAGIIICGKPKQHLTPGEFNAIFLVTFHPSYIDFVYILVMFKIFVFRISYTVFGVESSRVYNALRIWVGYFVLALLLTWTPSFLLRLCKSVLSMCNIKVFHFASIV